MGNLILFILLIGIAAFTSRCAFYRGRNPRSWFLIGFLFGILGLILLFILPPIRKKVVAVAPPAPISPFLRKSLIETFDALHIDKLWYYLDADQKQFGPMSIVALSQAWEEGKVNGQTYVWNENLENWEVFERILRPLATKT